MKRVLVTGASEGIGRAFAIKLAERGYAVTAVARNEERLDSLLKVLKGSGHSKRVADLSTELGITGVVKELTEAEPYTLLINNAGFGAVGDFLEVPLETARRMVSLNITALLELTYAFLARAERGSGLIQVSSTLSYLPMPNQTVYSATKAFVSSLSESLWYQSKKRGIRIVNLCPGSTATLFPTRSGGATEKIPKWVTESPEAVAERGIAAFEQALGPTVVSGWTNKLALLFFRFVSRRTLIEIMGRVRQ
jgi:uncharacterized protein